VFSRGETIVPRLSPCCRPSSTTVPVAVTDDLFSQMVVLDYYDGPASGFLQCGICGSEYHFYMLDWDPAQIVRIFALAPVPPSSLERLFGLLKAIPDRRVWIPPVFSCATEEQLSELYDSGIQSIIDRAATPTVVIAWSVKTENTLAVRGVDTSAASHLISWFDRQPYADLFDWFGYLGLVELWQA
jgi:hypothetical protein